MPHYHNQHSTMTCVVLVQADAVQCTWMNSTPYCHVQVRSWQGGILLMYYLWDRSICVSKCHSHHHHHNHYHHHPQRENGGIGADNMIPHRHCCCASVVGHGNKRNSSVLRSAVRTEIARLWWFSVFRLVEYTAAISKVT
jgi:hypothetical protein